MQARRFVVGVLALAAVCGPAFALSFGDITVHSHLGERFAGGVDFNLAPGEVAHETCFSVVPSAEADGVVSLTGATLTLLPSARGGTLQIRSAQPVNEPITRVAVQANCLSLGQLQRDYTVLLDPPMLAHVVVPVVAGESRARVASTQPAPGMTWDVRPGDSVASLAQTIHPRSRKASRELVQAIVAANPDIADLQPDTPLPAGSKLIIPSTPVAGRSAVARLSAEGAARPAAKSKGQQRSDRPRNKAPGSVAKTHADSGFRLKLSSGEMDLSRSNKLTEQERAELREKQLLMEADDQVANLLALKNSVKQLEAQLAQLQLKLNTTSPAPPAVSAPTPTAAIETQSPARATATSPTAHNDLRSPALPVSAKPVAQEKRENMFDRFLSHWYFVARISPAYLAMCTLLAAQTGAEDIRSDSSVQQGW